MPFLSLKKIVASFFILLSSCVVCSAYTLQGPHILDLMLKNLGSPKALWIDQKTYIYDEQGSFAEFNSTSKYLIPGQFRYEMSSGKNIKTHIFSFDKTLTLLNDKIISESERGIDHYKDLFLYNGRSLLQNKLKNIGIDTFVSSQGHFENQLFYIIGAIYPDVSVPQLWVQKDTFRPFRLIIKQTGLKDDPTLLEIRYSKWTETKKISYPLIIKFYINDNLIRKIKASNVKINPLFDKTIFDIEKSKIAYPHILENNKEGVSDVQKALDNFRKTFE